MQAAIKKNMTIASAIILSIGAVLAVMNLVSFSTENRVSAAPSNSYTSIDLSNPWTVPGGRGTVSGGYNAAPNSLEMNIDNTNADSRGGGYQTEALMKDIPDSDSIKANLFVDPDWNGKDVRVGLWGQVYSPTYNPASSTLDTGPAWPFIEFTTMGGGGFTGFRVYDTRGGAPQVWHNLSSVPFSYGQTYNLEVTYNEPTESYIFYINNNEVLTLPASRSDDDNTPRSIFRQILFASYNSATGDSDDDYTALWTSAQYGVSQDAPTPPSPPSSSPPSDKAVVPGVPNTGRR